MLTLCGRGGVMVSVVIVIDESEVVVVNIIAVGVSGCI